MPSTCFQCVNWRFSFIRNHQYIRAIPYGVWLYCYSVVVCGNLGTFQLVLSKSLSHHFTKQFKWCGIGDFYLVEVADF